jgi:hypothetical protein|uniref:Uncharacterized protein n=1 Tax=viral metagenome TaxID=1070528 RepID=A0A6C0J1T3_9ZZZZ
MTENVPSYFKKDFMPPNIVVVKKNIETCETCESYMQYCKIMIVINSVMLFINFFNFFSPLNLLYFVSCVVMICCDLIGSFKVTGHINNSLLIANICTIEMLIFNTFFGLFLKEYSSLIFLQIQILCIIIHSIYIILKSIKDYEIIYRKK